MNSMSSTACVRPLSGRQGSQWSQSMQSRMSRSFLNFQPHWSTKTYTAQFLYVSIFQTHIWPYSIHLYLINRAFLCVGSALYIFFILFVCFNIWESCYNLYIFYGRFISISWFPYLHILLSESMSHFLNSGPREGGLFKLMWIAGHVSSLNQLCFKGPCAITGGGRGEVCG